ncbi:hypothetical protein Naga_100255g5 [Nannochloropsis gaditana]|uniref:Uncharacterized protein n=1 Tax=Nannochloropsis gaditana TaxID=72520 RepID=W7TMN1_9STRA|nr:hypothetical protein Naga_100255g5 [Nannochloropsis gaditana]
MDTPGRRIPGQGRKRCSPPVPSAPYFDAAFEPGLTKTTSTPDSSFSCHHSGPRQRKGPLRVESLEMAVARREDDEEGARLRRACEQLERDREEGEREVWNLRSRLRSLEDAHAFREASLRVQQREEMALLKDEGVRREEEWKAAMFKAQQETRAARELLGRVLEDIVNLAYSEAQYDGGIGACSPASPSTSPICLLNDAEWRKESLQSIMRLEREAKAYLRNNPLAMAAPSWEEGIREGELMEEPSEEEMQEGEQDVDEVLLSEGEKMAGALASENREWGRDKVSEEDETREEGEMEEREMMMAWSKEGKEVTVEDEAFR